mgnify:CR=1 FL=1
MVNPVDKGGIVTQDAELEPVLARFHETALFNELYARKDTMSVAAYQAEYDKLLFSFTQQLQAGE